MRMYTACEKVPSIYLIDVISDSDIRCISQANILVTEKLQPMVCLLFKVGWTTQKVILANNSSPEPIPGDWDNYMIWMTMNKNNIQKLSSYTVEEIRHILRLTSSICL